MGVFNFFIVIPEILASIAFQPLVKYVFNNQPVFVVMMGGASLLIAASSSKQSTRSRRAAGRIEVPQGQNL
jgi:hypothetical protein